MSRSRPTNEANNHLALLKALRMGPQANPKTVGTLIRYALRAEITKKEYYDLVKTALDYKCLAEVIKILLANVKQDQSILTDIFHKELKKGSDANIEYIQIFLDRGVIIINDGYIALNNTLQIALRNKCSANIIQLMLEQGAKVDNSNRGNSSIDQALYWRCDFATIQILFQHGALVTNQTEVKEITETSLHLAIEHNHSLETIEILLQNNALLVTKTINPYETTLSFALRKKSDIRILKLFSSFSPDFVKDSDRTDKYCLINQLFEIYQANIKHNPQVNDILEFLLNSGARPCNDIDNNSLDIAFKYHADIKTLETLRDHIGEIPFSSATALARINNDHYEEEFIEQCQKSDDKTPTKDKELDPKASSSCSDFRYRYYEGASIEVKNLGSHSL